MQTSKNKAGKRQSKKKVRTYLRFYRSRGVYEFMIKNSLRLILGLGGLALLLYFGKDYMPDLDYYFELMTVKFRPITILLVFTLSESLLGLIPPDLFILWGKQFKAPYAMVALLAALSYGGGIISYLIGYFIGSIPKVNAWMKRRLNRHFDQIQRLGGVLIVFAALFPLPFSPVCMAAGTLRFPFKLFLLLGLFRFARFFGYAYVLFKVV